MLRSLIKSSVQGVHFGQTVHLWACTDVLIGFGGKINGDPSTSRREVMRTLATNSSSTSSRVRKRAFAVGSQMLYRSLPDAVCDATSLTTFSRLLKGHLYTIAYGNN